MKNVLVPLDGSAEAEQALPYAQSLAGASGAQLILFRAVPAHRGFGQPATAVDFADAEDYLAQVQASIGEGVPTTTAMYCGNPAEAIVDEIGLRDADLVVMTTHARTGLSRFVHGSVAADVVARATIPVLVVPSGAHNDGLAYGWVPTVLVPLDGSAFSERALPVAEEVARLLSSRLELVEAVPTPEYPAADLTGLGVASIDVDVGQMQLEARRYLAWIAQQAVRGRTAESTPIISAPVSQPAVAIVNEARTRWAELVVMATHARSGLARLINGSVAETVVQQAERPVLLVPPRFKAACVRSGGTRAPWARVGVGPGRRRCNSRCHESCPWRARRPHRLFQRCRESTSVCRCRAHSCRGSR